MTSNSQSQNEDHEYLSQEGYENLKNKVNELKTKKRLEIAHHLEYAKSLGDLSENAEYAEAKEEQMANEAEIAKLDDILARATVVEHTTSDEVRIGSVVSCRKTGSNKVEFKIVGKEEANPLSGKISLESPLGKAFLGHKINDKILVSTPGGQIEYHIIDIA